MQDYIINPSWFYWINIVDSLKTCFMVIFTVCFIIIFVFLGLLYFAFTDDYSDDKDFKIFKKGLIISSIVLGVSTIGLIFVPSKNTMIEMMAAKTITKSNIEYAEQEVKELVDYIFEKCDGKN